MHCEGDHEVMPRHTPIKLFFKPLSALLILAGRTVTVTARTMDGMVFPAFLTAEPGRPTGGSAAIDDCVLCFAMFLRDSVAKL